MKLTLSLLAALLLAPLATSAAPAAEPVPAFQSARPVWPEGREKERNLLVEFRAAFDRPEAGPVVLRLAGASLYRVFVNGAFAGHGPARAWHGFYRLDEWDLAPHLRAGRNEVVVEVAGYNVNSFYLLDQPSFLQAEIVAVGRVLAATGGDGFAASIRHDRVQKVQRYSFQRPFSEVWRLPGPPAEPARCVPVADKPLAPRRVPYPAFEVRRPVAHVFEGEVQKGELPKKVWKDRSLTEIGPLLGGFPEAKLTTIPSIELQAVKTVSSRPAAARLPFVLQPNSYRTVDLGVNLSGFIGARITARTRTRLFVTFDEILSDNDVSFKRVQCVNAVLYELEPGTHAFETFEPYSMRYIKFTVLEGECEVADCYLRELANPEAARAQFTASDERHNRIFEAARECLRQNATDVLMTDPSQERAGSLLDSYFTGRAAIDFCGTTTVEKNFLENYARAERFDQLPEGMVPWWFPADPFYGGHFISNVGWFVLQIEEYAARSRDQELVEALKPRVLGIVKFFEAYENGDGLLEKLPHWVFVDHSKARDFVQDVNYPSSMLYAGMLDAANRLYALPELAAKAARIRETIRRQSFDGEFFVDNAVRRDGKLQVTTNRTEACQYYAFFFDVATPQTHAKLWQTLTTDFGPQRKQTKAFPDIHPCNMLVGNMLRFELLSRYGRNQQILDEALGYWLYMVEMTGTLWEHETPNQSCTDGYQSHAGHVLLRDVLGLSRVDAVSKTVRVRFADLKLTACRGSVPTPDGSVELAWRKEDGRLVYRLKVPEGYRLDIDNRSGLTLVKEP
jgi:alpha-L-rhamnosidase